jgi:hypothetical protein
MRPPERAAVTDDRLVLKPLLVFLPMRRVKYDPVTDLPAQFDDFAGTRCQEYVLRAGRFVDEGRWAVQQHAAHHAAERVLIPGLSGIPPQFLHLVSADVNRVLGCGRHGGCRGEHVRSRPVSGIGERCRRHATFCQVGQVPGSAERVLVNIVVIAQKIDVADARSLVGESSMLVVDDVRPFAMSIGAPHLPVLGSCTIS